MLRRSPRSQRRYRPGIAPDCLFSRAARTAARTLSPFIFSIVLCPAALVKTQLLHDAVFHLDAIELFEHRLRTEPEEEERADGADQVDGTPVR